MDSRHLTLRLAFDDAQLIDQLQADTGLSKSDLVKQALRQFAQSRAPAAHPQPTLFTLGAAGFGRHGDASRQSSQIKAVVRQQSQAKRGE